MTEKHNFTSYATSAAAADEIIIVDPTRGNDLEGTLLIFRQGGADGKGYIVHCSQIIDMKSVKEVTFHNAVNPYLPNAYQIVITADSDQCSRITIPAGYDVTWAMQVVLEIEKAIFPA